MDEDDYEQSPPEREPEHVRARRAPLPWEVPKPVEEDPEAPQRVRQLIEGPGYRQADQDVEFLNLDATRGVRLEIDYLKAELLLRRHGIRHTIVVFGSTRIPESAAAWKKVARARDALKSEPDSPPLQRALRIAERLAAKSRYYDVAREFGRLVGRAGAGPQDSRLIVVTGGGPGIMEAGNRGAFDVGAESAGLNITLPREQYPNPYITPDLCFRFHYFAIRKLHFLLRAKALVAFPGGYGTFDELFETLTLAQTRKIEPVPVILVGEEYWRRAVDIDFLVEEGTIDAEDRELFSYAENARDIWEGIINWHRGNGHHLFD